MRDFSRIYLLGQQGLYILLGCVLLICSGCNTRENQRNNRPSLNKELALGMSQEDFLSVLGNKGTFQFQATIEGNDYYAIDYELVKRRNFYTFLFKNGALQSISNEEIRAKEIAPYEFPDPRLTKQLILEERIQAIVNCSGFTIPEFMTDLEENEEAFKNAKTRARNEPGYLADEIFTGSLMATTLPIGIIDLPFFLAKKSSDKRSDKPFDSNHIQLGMNLNEVQSAIAPASFSAQEGDSTIYILGPEQRLDTSDPRKFYKSYYHSIPYLNLWTGVVMKNDKVIRVLSDDFYSSDNLFRYEYAVSPWVLENFTYKIGEEPIELLPAIDTLPNVLLGKDSELITDADTWEKQRYDKRKLLEIYEYGEVPHNHSYRPQGALKLRYKLSKSTLELYQVTFGRDEQLTTTVNVYTPHYTEGQHFPLIMSFGLGGEHAEAANERGYIFVSFDHEALDPETEGYDVIGPAQALYPYEDWGSVGMWVWGAGEVLSFLSSEINGKPIAPINFRRRVLTGDAHTGKAALLAGVRYTGFDIVVANGSGTGGAAAFRSAGNGAETLEEITKEARNKSLFHEDFGRFAQDVNKLPFDQHFLRALIAPRIVLSTDALDDKKGNPQGLKDAWIGAQPVFDLLGVPDHNLIHFRQGGKGQSAADFEVLLDVADAHFAGEAMPEYVVNPSWVK